MIEIISNRHLVPDLSVKKQHTSFLGCEEINNAGKFFKQYPGYRPTPLHALPGLAAEAGISNIYVKDESTRLGLNSFKPLGGFYAIARVIAEKLGIDYLQAGYNYLSSEEAGKILGKITFTTATDGNHGRGVAMAATAFGHHARVYLPRGSKASRVRAVEEEGGTAIVTDFNYDDTVSYVSDLAEEKGYTVVQDTVMEGYNKIPAWIMQGYALMIKEILDTIEDSSHPAHPTPLRYPTHIILQAGVGSFPAAVAGYLLERLGERAPSIIIAEPENAACFFKSASGDGTPLSVGGDLETIMAGLACGVPNPTAWDILKINAGHFLSLPDWVAARGVRVLRCPIYPDPPVISGESGSVGTGLLSILGLERFESLKSSLDMDKDTIALVFNTEGVTDPVLNREILWDGRHPTPS